MASASTAPADATPAGELRAGATPAGAAPTGAAPTGAAPTRSSLRREDWIAAATEVLHEQSIDAVRIETLAAQLKVTRGSFYWHFRNRNELLESLLLAWRNSATEQVIDRFERRVVDPHTQIRELLTLPFRGQAARRAAATELAIRDWARRDEMARKMVDEVDAIRLSYIAQSFSSLGMDIAEARHRAFALYAYEVAESLMPAQGTDTQKRERRAFMESLLLARAG